MSTMLPAFLPSRSSARERLLRWITPCDCSRYLRFAVILTFVTPSLPYTTKLRDGLRRQSQSNVDDTAPARVDIYTLGVVNVRGAPLQARPCLSLRLNA